MVYYLPNNMKQNTHGNLLAKVSSLVPKKLKKHGWMQLEKLESKIKGKIVYSMPIESLMGNGTYAALGPLKVWLLASFNHKLHSYKAVVAQ